VTAAAQEVAAAVAEDEKEAAVAADGVVTAAAQEVAAAVAEDKVEEIWLQMAEDVTRRQQQQQQQQ
jgi:hypothetical protein